MNDKEKEQVYGWCSVEWGERLHLWYTRENTREARSACGMVRDKHGLRGGHHLARCKRCLARLGE